MLKQISHVFTSSMKYHRSIGHSKLKYSHINQSSIWQKPKINQYYKSYFQIAFSNVCVSYAWNSLLQFVCKLHNPVCTSVYRLHLPGYTICNISPILGFYIIIFKSPCCKQGMQTSAPLGKYSFKIRIVLVFNIASVLITYYKCNFAQTDCSLRQVLGVELNTNDC